MIGKYKKIGFGFIACIVITQSLWGMGAEKFRFNQDQAILAEREFDEKLGRVIFADKTIFEKEFGVSFFQFYDALEIIGEDLQREVKRAIVDFVHAKNIGMEGNKEKKRELLKGYVKEKLAAYKKRAEIIKLVSEQAEKFFDAQIGSIYKKLQDLFVEDMLAYVLGEPSFFGVPEGAGQKLQSLEKYMQEKTYEYTLKKDAVELTATLVSKKMGSSDRLLHEFVDKVLNFVQKIFFDRSKVDRPKQNLKKNLLLIKKYIQNQIEAGLVQVKKEAEEAEIKEAIDVAIFLDDIQELAFFVNTDSSMAVFRSLEAAFIDTVDVIIVTDSLVELLKRKYVFEHYVKNSKFFYIELPEGGRRRATSEELIKLPEYTDKKREYDKRYEQLNSINNTYSLFESKGSKFVVFVKKTKSKQILNCLKNIAPILSLTDWQAPSDLQNRLMRYESVMTIIKIGKKEIDEDELISIFNPACKTRKYIYIIGHGKDSEKTVSSGKKKIKASQDSLIAQLNSNQMAKFLECCNTIHCLFLYISSCFAGGLNMYTMHMKQIDNFDTLFDKVAVGFPIAVGSVTSSVSLLSSKTNFDKFFQGLHIAFMQEYASKSKETIAEQLLHKNVFKEALQHMAGKDIVNLPSIRFPGIDTFFRVVDIDNNVLVVTYPYLAGHAVKVKKLKGNERAIQAVNKEAILIYSSVVNFPIEIGAKATPILSMVPGPSNHYIESIVARSLGLQDILRNSFVPKYRMVARKTFFIAEVTCKKFFDTTGIEYPKCLSTGNKDQEIVLKNCCVHVDISNGKQDYVFALFQESTTHNWFIMGYRIFEGVVPKAKILKYHIYKELSFGFGWIQKGQLAGYSYVKKLDREYALKKIREFIISSEPIEEALYKAAGDSMYKFRNAVNNRMPIFKKEELKKPFFDPYKPFFKKGVIEKKLM